MNCKHGNCKKKRNINTLVLTVLALVMVVSILVGLVFFLIINREPCPTHGWYDPSAKIGDIKGKTKEEIESDLNSLIDEGMFHISIASVIQFKDGKSKGEARIANISANPYNMKVKITLDECQKVVYESKGIAPGQYIDFIELNKDLPKGEYKATALFSAYTTEDLLYVGQVAAKISIVIEK